MKCEEDARRIMEMYRTIAFCDYASIATWDGKYALFKSSEEIPEAIRQCIQEIENTPNGIKVKLASKEKALEMLAKMQGMFVNLHKVVGEEYESIIDRLTKEDE